jgi:hypothetical protein
MAQRKTPQSSKKKEVSIVRSSAAEYLTFIAASGQGGVEAIYADESIWLTQKMTAELYGVNVRTVNEHLKTIFADSELQEDSVIRKFRITAADGKKLQHLALHAARHHRRWLQGQFRAGGAVPQVGHGHHRAVHHQSLCDGRRAHQGGRLHPDRAVF